MTTGGKCLFRASPAQQARAHNGLGRACRALGDEDRARQRWELALSIFTGIGAPEASEVRAYLAEPEP